MFGFSQGLEAAAQSRHVGPTFKAEDGAGRLEVLVLLLIGAPQH